YDDKGRLYSYQEVKDEFHYEITDESKKETNVQQITYNTYGQMSEMEFTADARKMDLDGLSGNKQEQYGNVKFTFSYTYDHAGRMLKQNLEANVDGFVTGGGHGFTTNYYYDQTVLGYDSLGRTTKTSFRIHYGYYHNSNGKSYDNSGTTNNLKFDLHGRPIETYTTWTLRKTGIKGYGWDKDTKITYNTDGQKISSQHSYYSKIEAKQGGTFGSSIVTQKTYGEENITYKYDENYKLVETHRDKIWEKQKTSTSSSFWSTFLHIVITQILGNLIIPGLGGGLLGKVVGQFLGKVIASAAAEYSWVIANGGNTADAWRAAAMAGLFRAGVELGQGLIGGNAPEGTEEARAVVKEGTSFFGSIRQGISSFANAVMNPVNTIVSIFKATFTGISNIVGNITKTITSILKGLKNFLKNPGNLINKVFIQPVQSLAVDGQVVIFETELDRILITSFREAIVQQIAENNDLDPFTTQLLRGFMMNPLSVGVIEGIAQNLGKAGVSWGVSKIDTKDKYWDSFLQGFSEGFGEGYVDIKIMQQFSRELRNGNISQNEFEKRNDVILDKVEILFGKEARDKFAKETEIPHVEWSTFSDKLEVIERRENGVVLVKKTFEFEGTQYEGIAIGRFVNDIFEGRIIDGYVLRVNVEPRLLSETGEEVFGNNQYKVVKEVIKIENGEKVTYQLLYVDSKVKGNGIDIKKGFLTQDGVGSKITVNAGVRATIAGMTIEPSKTGYTITVGKEGELTFDKGATGLKVNMAIKTDEITLGDGKFNEYTVKLDTPLEGTITFVVNGEDGKLKYEGVDDIEIGKEIKARITDKEGRTAEGIITVDIYKGDIVFTVKATGESSQIVDLSAKESPATARPPEVEPKATLGEVYFYSQITPNSLGASATVNRGIETMLSGRAIDSSAVRYTVTELPQQKIDFGDTSRVKDFTKLTEIYGKEDINEVKAEALERCGYDGKLIKDIMDTFKDNIVKASLDKRTGVLTIELKEMGVDDVKRLGAMMVKEERLKITSYIKAFEDSGLSKFTDGKGFDVKIESTRIGIRIKEIAFKLDLDNNISEMTEALSKFADKLGLKEFDKKMAETVLNAYKETGVKNVEVKYDFESQEIRIGNELKGIQAVKEVVKNMDKNAQEVTNKLLDIFKEMGVNGADRKFFVGMVVNRKGSNIVLSPIFGETKEERKIAADFAQGYAAKINVRGNVDILRLASGISIDLANGKAMVKITLEDITSVELLGPQGMKKILMILQKQGLLRDGINLDKLTPEELKQLVNDSKILQHIIEIELNLTLEKDKEIDVKDIGIKSIKIDVQELSEVGALYGGDEKKLQQVEDKVIKELGVESFEIKFDP
ncbi:hypothetical protein MUO65_07800, partial [bacterium]|nr:hypothetical protein [bacterium]